MITYTYKKQGDGRDSWIVKEFDDEELIKSYMIYESPLVLHKRNIDKQILKLFAQECENNWYTGLVEVTKYEATEEIARALSLWYDELWNLTKQYYDQLTEESINHEFVDTLPKFSN